MTKLEISPTLALPVDAVTQTFAILGIRGSGKTNTGVVMAEELLARGQQVVIIDPVDVWWGLKSSKDGKKAGFSIPVIGGDHADIPLDGGAGQVLADFVADSRASVILSLRHLSMNDQRRFAGDFAKRLYERKGEQRSPLMLIVDEADEFVPQRIEKWTATVFGAFDRLVRRGRSSGIGVTLISQRAQVLNKDVLSQMETLIGMRVLHKLDRKALEAWIEAHDTEGRRDEFLGSLASLGRGDAWVWSPSWLNVFERVSIRARHTYDSSATPKTGERVAPPKELAPIDLEQLRDRMAAQIERAKQDDPKALRAEIAELRRKLDAADQAPAARSAAPSGVDKAAADRAVVAAVARTASEAGKEFSKIIRPTRAAIERAAAAMEKAAAELRAALPAESVTLKVLADLPAPASEPRGHARTAPRPSLSGQTAGARGAVTGPQRRILDGLAWLESIGLRSGSKNIVGFLGEASPSSSSFTNNLGALRTAGLIDYPAPGEIALTDAGRASAAQVEAPLTSEDLHARIYQRLPRPQCRILQVLIAHRGAALSKDKLAELAEASPTSSSYTNNLGALRSLGLIDYPQRGEVQAQKILFLEGR